MLQGIYRLYNDIHALFSGNHGQIKSYEERIESYTQIKIGDKYIPKIDPDIFLCIPAHEEFNQIYVQNFEAHGYQINKLCSNRNYIDKTYNPQHPFDLTNEYCKLSNYNYFLKINEIPCSVLYYDHKIEINDEYLVKIQYQYAGDVYIIMRSIKNNLFHEWYFDINYVPGKQIWIAFEKNLVAPKSARKN